MAATTVESLKIFLNGASGVPDALLEKVLNSARLKVQRDGVSVSHDSFADLQEYYAASLLESTGAIQGMLVSKSVADVSETYNQSVGMSYKDIYYQTLRDVVGKKGFIV